MFRLSSICLHSPRPRVRALVPALVPALVFPPSCSCQTSCSSNRTTVVTGAIAISRGHEPLPAKFEARPTAFGLTDATAAPRPPSLCAPLRVQLLLGSPKRRREDLEAPLDHNFSVSHGFDGVRIKA